MARLTPFDPDYNPLKDLPEEFVPAVSYFWAFHQTLLGDAISFVVKIRTWIIKDGLTLDELKRIFDQLTRPEVCAELKFKSDLETKIASRVAAACRLRHFREVQQQNARELADKARDQNQFSIAQKVADRFRTPLEDRQ